jgi:HEAT repeat protein
LIIVVAILALLAFGAFLAFHSREPSYHGKRLNAWLDDYIRFNAAQQAGHAGSNPEAYQKVQAALASMGTDTVPFIIQRLASQDEGWSKRYRTWWTNAPAWSKRILPAPALQFSEYGYGSASSALYLAGPKAIPLLTNALQHPNWSVRETAIDALHSHSSLSNSMLSAVPAFTAALSDPSSHVRLFSAGILGNCGSAASNAVPALIICLHDSDTDAKASPGSRTYVRAWSATALGKIGPVASNAVPVLKPMMQDSDANLRMVSTIAVWRIDGDVETTLPILMQDLPKTDPNSKWQMLDALREMGPRAKAAVPLLQAELPSATPFNRDKITDALQKIDPTAQAR